MMPQRSAGIAARVIQRVRLAQRYFRLFDNFVDRVRYYRCRHGSPSPEPVALRVRGVPVPLWCRPRSTDAATLWGTFGEAYHLPETTLPADAVIVDLGANVGYTMVDFARRYPGARVLGVEMDADNAAVATRNVAPLGSRCTVVHAAVWLHDGWVAYEGEEEWGYRVCADGARGSAAAERRAPSRRVTSVLSSAGLEQVDFLKMDIEGAETQVLGDGADWLSRVVAITLEVHSFAAVSVCRALLERSGFVVRLHPRHPRGLLGHREGSALRR